MMKSLNGFAIIFFIGDCNNAFCNFFGFNDKNEIVGNSILKLFGNNKENFKPVFENYNEVEFKVENQEVKHQSFNGKIIYSLDNSYPIIKEGHLYSIQGMSSIITEKKLLENQIKKTKDQLTNFIQTNPASIYFIGFKKPMPMSLSFNEKFEWIKKYEFIEDCNDSVAEEFGYQNKKDIIGMSSYKLYGSTDEALKGVITPAINNDFYFKDVITKEITKDGKELFFLNSSLPQIIDGHLHSTQVISLNITKEKMLEEALKKEIISKDNFISILSHDLRSPMATLKSSTELLVKKLKNKEYENMQKFAEILRDGSRNTLSLLEDLLDWNRSQRGKISFNPDLIKISLIIESTIKLLKQSANEKEINLKLDIDPNHEAYLDKIMIKTILRNLLSNAIKFTPKNGNIEIKTKILEDYLEIYVSDDGIGMEKEQVNQLFDGKYYGSSPGTDGERGTGFGLLICQEFIERNNGDIIIESEIGKGSTFIVRLPRNSS